MKVKIFAEFQICISVPLSTKLIGFYDMVKIRLIMINNVNIFLPK